MSTQLVLLPGMMCDARLFAPQIAALSAQRDILLPRLAGADSIAGLARAVLDKAPQRFALAGLSMGGIVAMEILRQAPERVERIALLATNPLAETAEVTARRQPHIEAVRAGRLAAVTRDDIAPTYLSDGPQRTALLDLCVDMAMALGPEVFLSQSSALITRADQTATLRGADLPALVLCGRTDRLCPLSRHELMASLLSKAELCVIEGASHLPTLEQPEDTNAALTRWLEA